MRYHSLIICLLGTLLMGTTYIIKENGVEVGRWQEDDGSDAVEVIENNPPPRAKKVAYQAAQPKHDGYGNQWDEPVAPEGEIKMWKVSGQVIDLVRLRGVRPDKLTFHGPGKTIEATTNFEGYFTVELPAFEKSGYTVLAKASDYISATHLKVGDSFRKLSRKTRLMMNQNISSLETLRGNQYDIEVGIYPQKLTPSEQSELLTLQYGHTLNPGR